MSTPNPTTPSLNSKSQSVITAFGKEPNVTADQVKNLTDAITASPELVNQFNRAFSQGHLKAIKPLANANAGGEYHRGINEVHMSHHIYWLSGLAFNRKITMHRT